ncbi:MAG: hypothetical protein WCX23_02405 [Candidatus Paceibacterota bacterium]|jgi:hypothetical protein|nr:hypothetical protein [Candidatus Paceibacterota bacterium]MDD4831116.1 hypothetical protein [Candidatus Paceibacterota bacterium]MDD4874994.1 hypothetical protein [Candidatus Paceibacterota bacterium]
MAKKIFDIIPPGGSLKEKDSLKTKNFSKKSDFQRRSDKPEKESSSNFSAKFLALAIVLILLGAAAYFLVESEANIKIWPEIFSAKTQDQVLLKAGDAGQQIDFEQKIVPAVLIQKTLEQGITVSATGPLENDAKAKGTLRVYNKYEPPTALTLVKNTRFLSSPQEKTFKALSAIHLPAATYEGGKLVPGFVDITVEADESGSGYNIDSSSRFSIPKLVGTSYFYTTWAENIGSLEGGSDTGAKTVTKEDLDDARSRFFEEGFEEAKKNLSLDVQSGFVLIDTLVSQELEGELEFSAEEGDARDAFVASGRIISKALVFRQKDIDTYASNLLSNLSDSSGQVVPESLKAVSAGRSIDFGEQTALLDLSITAKTYSLEEEKKIKELLRGQKIDSAVSLINNYSGIKKADIELSPFWKKQLPSDLSKMQVELIFNE